MAARSKTALGAVLLIVFACVIIPSFPYAIGHGVGYETLPPQLLGNKMVAMEVNSNLDNSTGKKQISFFLFETSTGITVRDVRYEIAVIKNGGILFDEIRDTHDGILTLDLVPDKSDTVTVSDKSGAGLLGSLLGQKNNILESRGKIFEKGGLYKFSIRILGAESYSGGPNPVTFESGISFPEYTTITIDDAHFGRQEITEVSYYDVLTGMEYDGKTRTIKFSMPFEWTEYNINQTSVVHQEIIIPKTFGTLQVSEYAATVNGILLSNQTITIDDFPKNNRIAHILLYQAELKRLYEKQQDWESMDFALFPKSDDMVLVGTTDNVQYKIAVRSIPERIHPGSDVKFSFQIYDVFLLGKTVSVDYDARIESGGNVFYKTKGRSAGEKTVWDEIKLTIPDDASDKITLHFENLGGNGLARTEIPIVLGSQSAVPSWIKSNAGWWCKKLISDDEFLSGIGYLINKGIIQMPQYPQNSSTMEIPSWVRSSACEWSADSVLDGEFINAIAFLVKNGLIKP